MPRARLTRELIIEAAEELLHRDRVLTMSRLGERLGADPSAMYRHFRDKDELLRAIGDRLVDGVLDDLPDGGGWRAAVGEVCRRLRAVMLRHPDLSALVRDRPPIQPHEIALTDVVLGQLRAAGLDGADAALAYHALIELTIGSAMLDAAMAALPDATRAAEYEHWRRSYAEVDPLRHPHAVSLAEHLYRGSADDRFDYALERLLDGIEHALRARRRLR
jgi:AcrR family transcriptional regulator